MPQPFAAVVAQLGVATAAMLADATLTVGDEVVDGMFDESHSAPGDMVARSAAFFGAAEALDALALEAEDQVTVTRNGSAVAYRLAMAPQPLAELGQTRLDLKRVALA